MYIKVEFKIRSCAIHGIKLCSYIMQKLVSSVHSLKSVEMISVLIHTNWSDSTEPCQIIVKREREASL